MELAGFRRVFQGFRPESIEQLPAYQETLHKIKANQKKVEAIELWNRREG
jgi:hypothetical protein